MGCNNSAPEKAPQPIVVQPATVQAVETAPPASKGSGKGKGKGKSKGKGKGKGTGKGKFDFTKKFQVELSGSFQDYGDEEDTILKRAFLVGHPNAKYSLRGQDYEYNFKQRLQRNLTSGKERKIRPPPGMKPPAKPVLPPGPMVVITVKNGQPGQVININDPHNPGEVIPVQIPARAKPGQKVAVPIPAKGETAADVKTKQEGWSTTSKAAAAAVVGGIGVGGVVLGDHLTDGAGADWATDAATDAGDWAADAAADAGAWAGGAVDDVSAWVDAGGPGAAVADAGDWAAGAADDAGDWAAGAADDAGDWAAGAADDAGDWAGGAVDDASGWLGDTADDMGDFVMSLF